MSDEKEMSFLDHLEELRWHLVRSAFAIVIFMIVAFICAPWIFENIVFAPTRVTFPTFGWLCDLGKLTGAEETLCVKPFDFKIQSRYLTGQFTMQFMAAFVIGLIIAFPYVFWEIWRFVKPGLKLNEAKNSRGAVVAVTFLFMMGVLFGYFLLVPLMTWFFATYTISPTIVNEFDITYFVSTFVMLVLGSGILFQLPVVVYFLTRIGILTPQFMRVYRKHSYVVILVVGAIVTPPDILSQVLISMPLFLLYEISIFISAYVARQRKLEEEQQAKTDEQTA